MRARPELVGGRGSPDTELMRALPGWIAKGGAEGLFCAAAPDGTGIALKAEDGSYRSAKPALHRFFLDALGLELPGFDRVPLRNSRGEVVGELAIGGP
jgi:L-asparaginase II